MSPEEEARLAALAKEFAALLDAMPASALNTIYRAMQESNIASFRQGWVEGVKDAGGDLGAAREKARRETGREGGETVEADVLRAMVDKLDKLDKLDGADPTHHYVYRFTKSPQYPGGYYVYVCTMPTAESAKERVAELGPHAVYVIGHLIRGAFY